MAKHYFPEFAHVQQPESFEVTVPERPVFTDWNEAVELAKLSQEKVVNRTPGQPRYLLADFTVEVA